MCFGWCQISLKAYKMAATCHSAFMTTVPFVTQFLPNLIYMYRYVFLLLAHLSKKCSYWAIGISQYVRHVSRQQFDLNDNSSYITGPILTKLHRNVPWVTRYKNSFKANLTYQKTWRPRGMDCCGRINFRNHLKQPLGRIQSNIIELITGWPSTKIARTNLIRQKTWPPMGMTILPYKYIWTSLNMSFLFELSKVLVKGFYIQWKAWYPK